MVGADLAATLMARLLGPRLLTLPRALCGTLAAMFLLIMAAAARLALMFLVLILLDWVASLLGHEHRLLHLLIKGTATPAMPRR
jgi:hypothetical protein